MNVVSLFDGMACGMLAMLRAGVKVDSYHAYEVDKYAIQTATHNFPEIVECGDVFQADFTKYHDIDFIVGGSPCTYWSIAQKNGREIKIIGKPKTTEKFMRENNINFLLTNQGGW